MTRQDHTHGRATPDAGTYPRQRQAANHGAPWAGQWIRDQLDRMESEAAIARIRKRMDFNEESV